MSKNKTAIFGKEKLLIGMVHLDPLLGYKEHSSMKKVIANAVHDAKVLQDAGYDAILVENNYDLPHKEFVGAGSIVSMAVCFSELKKVVKVPMGVCVLWNDYKTALALAKIFDLQFVRIPVFVDNVRTVFGDFYACNEKLNEYKKTVGVGKEVLVFTDIQVKHSELLNVRPLIESAKEAVEKGSDGVIVTGKWTGDAPKLEKLRKVKESVGTLPVIVGSGTNEDNLSSLLTIADVLVVGTSIKEGQVKNKSEERNLMPYENRIDPIKAKKLLEIKYHRSLSALPL
jgi:uncharacterized protein